MSNFNEKLDRQKVKRLLGDLLLNRGSSKENLTKLAEEIFPNIQRDLITECIEHDIDEHFRNIKGCSVNEVSDERDFYSIFLETDGMSAFIENHENLTRFFEKTREKYNTSISLNFQTHHWVELDNEKEASVPVTQSDQADPTFAVELN